MVVTLKTRKDFETEDEYRRYTKTGEFLTNYSWKGKKRDEIIFDMAMPDYEIRHLDEAMKIMEEKGEFLAVDLDRLIMCLHEEEVIKEMNV